MTIDLYRRRLPANPAGDNRDGHAIQPSDVCANSNSNPLLHLADFTRGLPVDTGTTFPCLPSLLQLLHKAADA